MKLCQYLHKNKIHITEFSRQISYSPSTISNILNGRFKAGKHLRICVESITNGDVKITEWEYTRISKRKIGAKVT